MYSKQRCEEDGLLKVPQKHDPNCTRYSEQLSRKETDSSVERCKVSSDRNVPGILVSSKVQLNIVQDSYFAV